MNASPYLLICGCNSCARCLATGPPGDGGSLPWVFQPVVASSHDSERASRRIACNADMVNGKTLLPDPLLPLSATEPVSCLTPFLPLCELCVKVLSLELFLTPSPRRRRETQRSADGSKKTFPVPFPRKVCRKTGTTENGRREKPGQINRPPFLPQTSVVNNWTRPRFIPPVTPAYCSASRHRSAPTRKHPDRMSEMNRHQTFRGKQIPNAPASSLQTPA